ncbi:MAG: hypothetical protein L0177_15660, partial [Chloroflexi bacterium]|nr:hypothetical protein [Chloroflexota bacterium]
SWSDITPYIRLEGVRAVLHSPHLKNLTHLRLRLTTISDQGCEEIVRSGILKRLKVLDLRHGAITNEGARILAACPDLANLELLDLMRNRVTATGLKRLRAVVANVRADYPLTEEQLEQQQYLYEGDHE